MTKIEWATITRNPFVGCGPDPASIGCQHCYAVRWAWRHQCNGLKQYQGVAEHPKGGKVQWTGKVNYHPKALDDLGKLPFGTKVFICSMSDIFHENIKEADRIEVFKVLAENKHILLICLTKRAENMARFLKENSWVLDCKHIMMGVTAETSEHEYDRVETLCEVWPHLKFVSHEPLLSGFSAIDMNCNVDLRVVGGETGPGYRYSYDDFEFFDDEEEAMEWWLNAARDFLNGHWKVFFKKPPGRTHKEDTDGFTTDTPEYLRVRQFPEYKHLLERKG